MGSASSRNQDNDYRYENQPPPPPNNYLRNSGNNGYRQPSSGPSNNNYQSVGFRPEMNDIPIELLDAKISWTDMEDPDMKEAALFICQQAFNSYNIDEDRAIHVKRNFQMWYNYGAWHCVVGSLFGSRVTHDRGHFMNIQVRDKCFILWKCGSSV